jgi:hypothetical protein
MEICSYRGDKNAMKRLWTVVEKISDPTIF